MPTRLPDPMAVHWMAPHQLAVTGLPSWQLIGLLVVLLMMVALQAAEYVKNKRN